MAPRFVQLIGAHWAVATALAFTTATRLGANPEAAIRAIESVPPTGERLSLIVAGAGARFLLRATHDVRCWIDDCEKRGACLDCPLLGPLLE